MPANDLKAQIFQVQGLTLFAYAGHKDLKAQIFRVRGFITRVNTQSSSPEDEII